MKALRRAALWVTVPAVVIAAPVRAQGLGDAVALDEAVTIDPIVAFRARFEGVDQGGFPEAAEAVTVRGRIGAELKAAGFAFLAEAEGTIALSEDYNDTLPLNGPEPFPTVADPETVELNRFQVSYMRDGTGVTLGRQRIILDNARFVGNVGWRQNEQTFDALRGQAKVGRVSLDATYASSQRTVFGSDSPNSHFDGDLVLLNGGVDFAAAELKAFAYLLDYEARPAFSSQTYGMMLTAEMALPGRGNLTAFASYAIQSDLGDNPAAYRAEYFNAQAGLELFGFRIIAGYEELGSDKGVAAFQTPLATLHAFNGWADIFLTTPATGLRDRYAGIGRTIEVPFLPAMRADLIYHHFDSDFGGLHHGSEWDAALGFTLGRVSLQAKYARYDAASFAVDTRKFWLQAEVAF